MGKARERGGAADGALQKQTEVLLNALIQRPGRANAVKTHRRSSEQMGLFLSFFHRFLFRLKQSSTGGASTAHPNICLLLIAMKLPQTSICARITV